MKNLVLHIRYLLTQHDCVIVPGWGALVMQHSDAQFATDSKLLPPRRWLSFNPLLAHNDAMLAHSLMRAEGCSYDEAMSYITQQVDTWRNALRSGETIAWEKIGCFKSQSEGTMLFEEAQDVEVNASMGLLQPLMLTHIGDVLPALEENELTREIHTSSTTITWHRKVWQAAASVAAIVILMLCISTPVDTYEASNDYASLVAGEIFGSVADVQQITEADAIAEEYATSLEVVAEQSSLPESIENVNNIANKQVVEPAEVVDSEQHNTAISHAQSTPRYVLVIGSLPSQSLAEKQIKEFKQQGVEDDIKIYESNGKYRLYIDGYDTMQQAQTQLAVLTYQPQMPFSGVWICATR